MGAWSGSGTFFAIIGVLVVSVRGGAPAQRVDYNQDIRPLLGRHCIRCHGRDEDHREGNLRLDDRNSALAEADSGQRAIVPGNPASSELLRRVSLAADDTDRMPPSDVGPRLDDQQIRLLRTWIEDDAPYARHWAFVPPRRPAVPKGLDSTWVSNAVDAFVLRRLVREHLAPNPPSDRYTLIRRLSLDLRGLPPTMEEVDRFVADTHSGAYQRLVDRMLADPAFGERWARVWLDLARYADSRGYGSDPLRPNMWRYRDWVINALNQNIPYDQFTIAQLAGDLLPHPTLDQQIATAFHRNTMTNTEGGTDDEEFRVAAVQDRVDTTLQVWMGLTIGCAKCHDHKYDPLTQRDYYRLFAIFNQTKDTDRPDEYPTIEAPRPEDLERLKQYEAKRSVIKQQLDAVAKQVRSAKPAAASADIAGRFVRVELTGAGRILSLAEVQVWQHQENLALKGKARQSSTDYEGVASRAIDGNTDGHYFNAKSTTHTRQSDSPWWELDLASPRQIERIVIWNRTDGGSYTRLANFRVQILDTDRKVVWETTVVQPPKSHQEISPHEITPLQQRQNQLQRQLAKIDKTRPVMPTVPVMQELEDAKRRATFVLVKGNFLTRAEQVKPGVPAAFDPRPTGSRVDRLALARWLVCSKNPLTARVAVNRFWAQLFGSGLVATEEDFGTQGDLPSHPELLDFLATEFVGTGWNVKKLLRLLVTSSTYRQSARFRPELLQRDPRNRLLARGPRFRLEAEMIRDQALAISGLLSRKIGGPSVYPYQPPGLWRAAFNGQRKWPISKAEDRHRRAIYTFWRRTVPYPSMATFDAPSRELCTLRRVRTNTPLQALVTWNDPVYVEAAQALARRLVHEGGDTPDARIRWGLRLCLVRPAEPRQIEILARLVHSETGYYRDHLHDAGLLATNPLGPLPTGTNPSELAAWTVVANVLLNLDGMVSN